MRVLAFTMLAACLVPATASAHIRMVSHESRHGDTQKTGPCGAGGSVRSDNVYEYEPGETISVSWEEYVPHPGHYRISFDDDGQDAFVDPSTAEELFTNDAVLMDGIADNPGTGTYTVDVTLPDVECDNCTLQVIQLMTDKAPYGDGNDIYYQCVDVTLRAGANPGGPDAGVDPDPTRVDGGGCNTSGTGGSALLVLLALAGVRRRQTRAA